jgi:outer membrane autotransporter protein
VTLTDLGVLSSSGSLTNAGSIAGSVTLTGTGGLSNAGSISNGVTLAGTSGLSNSGTITKTTAAAVYGNAGSNVTIVNTGRLYSQSNYGIYLQGTGRVTNGTGATIFGVYSGVKFGGTGTIGNDGTIVATGGTGPRYSGIYFGGNGTVTNTSTGRISGPNTGIYVSGVGQISNAGTIVGQGYYGVRMGGGTVTNSGSASVIQGHRYGIVSRTGPVTLNNDGTVSGGYFGLYSAGGIVTNSASGTISGGIYGVHIVSAGGTVINSGTILGTSGTGVVSSYGTLTNAAGGYIKGGTYGIVVDHGVVTNAGTILDNLSAGASLGTDAVLNNGTGGTIGGVVGVIFTGSGASLVNAGTITGTAGVAVQFDTAVNTLTLDTGSVLNGAIEGTSGDSQIVLAGTGTLANTIDFTAGGGALTVANTADWTASGTWTIASVTNSGTLQPGTPGNPLKLKGNFTQSSTGTLRVLLDDTSGTGSELIVTGQASLAGAVAVVPTGTFLSAKTYTIVSATDGVTGTFSTASAGSVLLTPTLSYDADDAYVTLVQGSVASPPTSPPGSPPSISETANQHAVAVAFDAGLAENPTGFASAIRGLDQYRTATEITSALTRLSGESHASLATTALQTGTAFTTQFSNQATLARLGDTGTVSGQSAMAAGGRQELARLDGGTDDQATNDVGAMVANIDMPWGVWGSGYGQVGQISGDGNSHRLDETIAGGAVGADYKLTPALRVGAGLGYGGTTFSLDDGGGRAEVDHTQFALYAGYTRGAAYLDGTMGVGYGDGTTRRNVALPGRPGVASGHVTDTEFTGSIEAGYGLPLGTAARLTPFVGLLLGAVDQDGFTETGAGALDLHVAKQSQSSVKSNVGARISTGLALGSALVTTDLSLAWAHEFAPVGRGTVAAFTGAPGQSFQVTGARLPGDSAKIGFGLATAVFANTSLYVHYDGDLASGATSNAITAGFRWSW